jgi:hypothetical protein
MQEIAYQLLPLAIIINAALFVFNIRMALAPRKVEDR